MPDMTKEDFTRRFIDYMCQTAGFTHFDDGTAVATYAADVVESYWADPAYREDGPENCAEGDMDYWGED